MIFEYLWQAEIAGLLPLALLFKVLGDRLPFSTRCVLSYGCFVEEATTGLREPFLITSLTNSRRTCGIYLTKVKNFLKCVVAGLAGAGQLNLSRLRVIGGITASKALANIS